MNFRIVIEQPKVIVTGGANSATGLRTPKQEDVTMLGLTIHVYDIKAKNEKAALPKVRTALIERLKFLRKQGLRMTKAQLLKADLEITRL